ncbi:MAG: F0F1 ATP synthase subunit B [Phycisphaerales bacterium]|nr:F0F1 ATP synthase subunit B [Planctomycetota bacterium]
MKRSSLVLTSAFLFVPATLAFANDEAVGALPTVKQGFVTGITALVVFLFVLALLATKVWPAISRGLDDRANKIRSEIEAAENARKQAADALAQYEASLAQARAEAAKMIESTKAQQTQLAAELKAKAEIELNAMRERAVKEIQQAKQSAAAELYSEATNLATMVAGKILKREINPQDQQRLVEESLGQLQSMRN